jgi:hypothetical protein
MANKPMTYANTNKIKLLYNIAMKKYYQKLTSPKNSNEILVFNTKDNNISVYASDTTLYIIGFMHPGITITDKHTISALSKQEMDRIINKIVKEMITEI